MSIYFLDKQFNIHIDEEDDWPEKNKQTNKKPKPYNFH